MADVTSIRDYLKRWQKLIGRYKDKQLEMYEQKPSGSVRMEITKANIMLQLLEEMMEQTDKA